MGELKFEEALRRLEAIVEQLETGDLPLEEALAAFEEGVKMVKLCSKRLNEVEKRVSILIKNAEGELEEQPFVPEEHGAGNEGD